MADLAPPPAPAVSLDDVDIALLRLLSGDARLSQRRLAAELGMSAPAIGERISRLERAGVIRGYSVRLDWDALGWGLRVYLSVTAGESSDLSEVLTRLRSIVEVEDVSLVTGTMDLLARLRVRDHAHLRSLLLEQVWQIAGVQRTETLIGIAEMVPEDFAGALLDSMRDAP